MKALLTSLLSPVVLLVFLSAMSCTDMNQKSATPPVAKIVPKKLIKHGHERIDNYFWLKERGSTDVLQYLEAENNYCNIVTSHTAKLQKKLADEFKARIKQTDETVPYFQDGYYYYSRMESGKEYPIYCRKKQNLEAPEEILLDVNKLAENHAYISVRGLNVSANNQILAFAVDTVGRRKYDIYFKDLINETMLPDLIPEATSNFVWANDSKHIFYTKQDPNTLRYYRIYRHLLGNDVKQDGLIWEEADDTYNTYISKSKSKQYLFIISDHTLSTEYRFLSADEPTGKFKTLIKRQKDHIYYVDHFEKHFYIRTNYKAINFKLVKMPVNSFGMKNWEEVIPHRENVLLESIQIFNNYLVVLERKNGLLQFNIRSWDGGQDYYLDFGEPAYWTRATNNYEFNTDIIRYSYSSLTTPDSEFDYNMKTQEKTLLKQDEVLGGFSSENYQIERLYADATDGVKVPVSLVFRKDKKKENGNPTLLYGYGSYGSGRDAYFSPYIISLLDRGFVYAIAHVRGGDEMGRQWYEDGKLFNKKNTFTDFIDCGKYLISNNYTDGNNLFAYGGSAGGLLMGAVVNMEPGLWKGVIASVPFVDVITTMLDETIPLTTSEYDEWGNPNVKDYYDYMLSYSPYDNVVAQNYPNLLVLTSYQDSQVQYWEPAKWVAKLRATKTDQNMLILKTQMEASHGGASGRYKRYNDIAFRYAFLLDLANIAE